MAEIATIPRTINFYYLEFVKHRDYAADGDKRLPQTLFEEIFNLSKTKAKIRYLPLGEKVLFLQDVQFKNDQKQITAKFRCVRKDIFSEIMDTETDEVRGIEAKENEGIVETTHLVIDLSTNKTKLAIEHNQFGSKISDLMLYIKHIGQVKSIILDCSYVPVVKNQLEKVQERIGKLSEFYVKVHKDMLAELKRADIGLFTVMQASQACFESDYFELRLKFDFKKRKETAKAKSLTQKLIRKILKDKDQVETFEELKVRAEDHEKNNLLETFDLLVDKVTARIQVQKRVKYRTVISADILSQMQNLIHTKRI